MANELVERTCNQAQKKNFQSTHMKKCGHCGISELWYLSMIECLACQQWFHEGCVKCLSHPLLLGDRFYVFACSSCNFGVEYVSRLPLTWLELVHLVLFHLTIKYRGLYFDVDAEILPWVKDHWEALQTGLTSGISDEERRKWFIETLKSNSNRFKCGVEVRKKQSWWALRVCCPPSAAKYELLISNTALTDSATNHIHVSGEPRFTDRNQERLQPVKKFHLNYPHKDEYYEKWLKCRSECKKRKRRNKFASVPKRKAALECREKCKKMIQRQRNRKILASGGCFQSTNNCTSKRNLNQTSSRRVSSRIGKDCRSRGPRTYSSYCQTLELNAKGNSSGDKILSKQPQARQSSLVLKGSQSRKRRCKTLANNLKGSQSRKRRCKTLANNLKGSQSRKRRCKTLANNDDVIKKRRCRKPRLCSASETFIWTHKLLADVESTAVEVHGSNSTHMEFTLLMARKIPFHSKPVDVREYFKGTSNLGAREGCSVMGKRISPDGLVQYLVVRNKPLHSLF